MDGLGLQPAPPSRSPLSARAFGPAVLLGELIGRGGMSRVYRGWLRGSGIEVAVKVLRDELAAHPGAVQRFVRERDLLAAVASPHVVRVHDLVVDGDELGIVMDLVAGGHLRKAVTFPCPPADAAGLAVQIADGLAAVHATGVVHRDLKPENVLVDTDDAGHVVLRLTDFGISRLVDAGTLTQTTVSGTPGYLAPEVAAGGQVTAAADVYALGVVLYELCTGRGPFLADNPIVMILAHTRQEAPRPGGMPGELWVVLSAMLAKDPAARPTASYVAATLRGLLPALAGLPPCTAPPPQTPPSLTWAQAPPTIVSPAVTGSPAGLAPPGPPLAVPGQLPRRRERYPSAPETPPSGPSRIAGLTGWAGPVLGRPPVLVAAAAAAVLLVVATGLGLRAALDERQPATVDQVTEPTSPPPPTGPPALTPTSPGPSTTGVPRTVTEAPRPAPPATHPAVAQGSTPPGSFTPPPAPGVPVLTRKEPTPAELQSTDGKVVLVLDGVSAGGGTIASISISYGQQLLQVPPQAGSPARYEVPIGNLTIGQSYTFTAKVCNSAKQCAPSAPFAFTPYGAPTVQAPSIKVAGQNLTVRLEPVLLNANPNETQCFLTLKAVPADPAAPQRQAVSADGGTVLYAGRPATTYQAKETCETAGRDDGSQTSPAVLTAGTPPPVTTSSTTTSATSSSTSPPLPPAG